MRFPARPPPFDLTTLAPEEVARILSSFQPTLPDGRYLHWDDLRNRPPPDGLTTEKYWLAQAWARRSRSVPVAGFQSEGAGLFWFTRLDEIERATHQLDRRDATKEYLQSIGDAAAQQQYRIDQIIEEAINSSVLEGAKLTTRAQAKAMIREGAAPRSHGDRMVMNNYKAMEMLLRTAKAPLTVEDIFEIHYILGTGALDTTDGAGRFRRADENVRVEDSVTGEVWFVPPPAAELPDRIARMLEFANTDDTTPFIHPLIRAIILHFWLAYLHPFVDGNGRMARALFYWQMLRSGYDFAQYLSISGPIDRSRRAYYQAFVFTETDGGDLTYFLLNQLGVLRRATSDLAAHLDERAKRFKTLSAALANAEKLNHRQQAVLMYLVRKPHQPVTVKGHATSHGVTYLTARKDLQVLQREGYLRSVRVGKTDRYLPSEHLVNRIVAAGHAEPGLVELAARLSSGEVSAFSIVGPGTKA